MEDGTVFKWYFPITGSHWTAADVAIQHISKEMGGDANLKGKKIALVYNDSPYGRDPIALLKARAKKMGFTFLPIPVTHPGIGTEVSVAANSQGKTGLRASLGLGHHELHVPSGGGRGPISA